MQHLIEMQKHKNCHVSIVQFTENVNHSHLLLIVFLYNEIGMFFFFFKYKIANRQRSDFECVCVYAEWEMSRIRDERAT